MTAYETITDELVKALDSYLELCEQPGMEFSLKGFGQYILDLYDY